MTSGTRSGFGIISDTYVVHPPIWDYQVSAEGYGTTPIFRLDEAENVSVCAAGRAWTGEVDNPSDAPKGVGA